eukprot:TRINITY_DN7642_c0_g1_i2.p1 TRINITY_DN7642_c0_g1~~TRINITY_DN7642_c0_g1_i2.p1  ORF type:complete len:255 (+),score=97.61 TRINITY_DN7642_c0_g1_i2:60-824(+)
MSGVGVPVADAASELEVLRGDLQELFELQKVAKRGGVVARLQKCVGAVAERIQELEAEKAATDAAATPPAPPAHADPSAAEPCEAEEAPLPDLSRHQNLATYSWTESAKSVKVYCDLKHLKDAPVVDCRFGPTSFFFYASDVPAATGGPAKCWKLAVPNLHDAIVPARSTLTRKEHKFVVTLWKRQQGVDWEHLTDVEKLKKQKHKELVDSGATTDQLLANMFKDADPETQAKLRAAALEGQKKREEDAKKRGM